MTARYKGNPILHPETINKFGDQVSEYIKSIDTEHDYKVHWISANIVVKCTKCDHVIYYCYGDEAIVITDELSCNENTIKEVIE